MEGPSVLTAVTGSLGQEVPAGARDIARRVVAEPGRALSHATRLGGELLRVSTGRSDRGPDDKDRRFTDPTWQHNRLYRAWLQSYLAWCDGLGGAR